VLRLSAVTTISSSLLESAAEAVAALCAPVGKQARATIALTTPGKTVELR
jgi:hypothetical protein